MALYLMLLVLLSGYSISAPIDSSTLSASQTTPVALGTIKPLEERTGKHNWASVCVDRYGLSYRQLYFACTSNPIGGYCDGDGYALYQYRATYNCELSCKCIQVGATNFDNCVRGMQASGCFGVKQLEEMAQSDLRGGLLNGTIHIPRGKTVEDFIQGSTTTATSMDLGTTSTIAAKTYPCSVPTTFSTATISSTSSADTVDLDRRGNTDWAFVCYKVGGQTPDKFATTFCQNQYRYLCDDQGRLQKTTFDEFCENICGCVNLASGKFRWGALCKASIMGPICAAVSDSIDTIDTVDTADTVDLDARDTTDWAMASSTAVQEAALARRQANSGALEPRYNYAFVGYHADATPNRLLTNLCQRKRGWRREMSGKYFRTTYYKICHFNCICMAIASVVNPLPLVKMCWYGINGFSCSKVVNGTTTTEVVSATTSCTTGSCLT